MIGILSFLTGILGVILICQLGGFSSAIGLVVGAAIITLGLDYSIKHE